MKLTRRKLRNIITQELMSLDESKKILYGGMGAALVGVVVSMASMIHNVYRWSGTKDDMARYISDMSEEQIYEIIINNAHIWEDGEIWDETYSSMGDRRDMRNKINTFDKLNIPYETEEVERGTFLGVYAEDLAEALSLASEEEIRKMLDNPIVFPPFKSYAIKHDFTYDSSFPKGGSELDIEDTSSWEK